MKSLFKSLGFSCSHWSKHPLFALWSVWLRLEQRAVMNEHGTPNAALAGGDSAVGWKDFPVENGIENTVPLEKEKYL